MRKVNPADVRAEFKSEAQEILDYFDRVVAALKGTPNEKSDISRLATNSFLAMLVAFERFLSDLFLAYMNRDFSKYQAGLVLRLNESVKAKFGALVQSRVAFATKKHFSLDEIEKIVDPTGWNVTFKNPQELKEKAKDWLAPPHAARIGSLTPSEERVVDTAKGIRDFIAHQSIASKKRMNDLLADVAKGGHYPHLARGVREIDSVGAYLKAYASGARRLHHYANALIGISAKM